MIPHTREKEKDNPMDPDQEDMTPIVGFTDLDTPEPKNLTRTERETRERAANALTFMAALGWWVRKP